MDRLPPRRVLILNLQKFRQTRHITCHSYFQAKALRGSSHLAEQPHLPTYLSAARHSPNHINKPQKSPLPSTLLLRKITQGQIMCRMSFVSVQWFHGYSRTKDEVDTRGCKPLLKIWLANCLSGISFTNQHPRRISDKRFLDHSQRVVNPPPPPSPGVRISDAVDRIGGGGGGSAEAKKKKQKAYRR